MLGYIFGVLGVYIEIFDGDVFVVGDECYVEGNYMDEVLFGFGLLWSECDWFESF